MRRIGMMLVSLLALTALTASLAFADSPKFSRLSSSVNDAGSLVVSFRETGLGNTPNPVHYTVTADATATYACLNGGGNHPKAANKETVAGQVSAGGEFNAENGVVNGGPVVTGPLLDPDFTCPSGQTRVLAAVTYTNIVLTDTDHNASTPIPGASRTFFNLG
jgi:hypothetical protein